MKEPTNKVSERVIEELRQSLAWMDLVLSKVGEGIIVAGVDMKVKFVNDAFAQMLGQSRINLLGQTIWEILELSANEEYLEKEDYQSALEQDDINSLSGRYKFKSAERKFTIDLTATFIQKIDQVCFIIRDITLQLQNEQELLEERIALTREQVEHQKAEEDRQLFQNIIDGTLSIIFLKDTEGKYELVNSQFEKVFGLDKTEIKGKADADLFPEETAEILSRGDGKVIENKELVRREESIKLENEVRHYLFLKYPLFNLEDNAVNICGVLTDITERKRLEENKDNFIRMVHHELNTPLTVMKLFLKSTRMNIEKGKAEEALNDFSKIEDQLGQMTKLTDDLIDATKMEKAELKFSKEEFDITHLVKETVENEQAKTEKHTVRLVESPSQYKILADKQRIGQVVRNLLSNAVKYSPEGGKINIRIKADANYLTVSVQDFGIGISKEVQKDIFGRFNRGGIQEDDFSGLGMGLYIAAEIIKHHGGMIDVKSEKGKGSTFSFRLPV